jgi:hypothetical protein
MFFLSNNPFTWETLNIINLITRAIIFLFVNSSGGQEIL